MTENEYNIVYRRKPCDECRDKKRKCSFGEPCERCERLNRNCVYTRLPSPKDREYLKELEQMNQVKELQQQLQEMEKQVGILKLQQEKAYLNDYPSPPYDDSSCCFDKSEQRIASISPSSSSYSDLEEEEEEEEGGDSEREGTAQPHEIENHLIAQSNLCQVFVNKPPEENNWVLHVKNGNMVVETCIQSHTDLLNNLQHILCDMKTTHSISSPYNYASTVSVDKDAIAALSAIAWKRYGKTRFEALTHCAPIDLNYNPNAQIARVNSPDDLLIITMKILHEYFNCHHYTQFTVYQPGFISLFRPREGESPKVMLASPAVMSLCGTVCLYACKHVGEIIPFDSLTDYAIYYFEQTKELLEDRFDECSMNVMCAYALLGTHKIKIKHDKVGLKYIELARRIYVVLEAEYRHKPKSEEYVFIQRIYRLIYQADIIVDIHRHMEDPYPKYQLGPVRLFKLMDSSDDIEITPAPGEKPLEVSYIQVRQHISNLRAAIKAAAGTSTRSETLPMFVNDISHKIEMAERHWYRHILPKKFQLSLPLFDDKVSDLDFFTTLEKECGNTDALHILPLIAAYNEYIIMARSYMPESPEAQEAEAKTFFFDIEVPSSGDALDVDVNDEKWNKVLNFILKYREISPYLQEYQGTQREMIDGMIRVAQAHGLKFEMPLTHVAISSAFNMVRLLQFLVSRDYTCFMDLRWLLNTWEILLRAARFQYQQPNDKNRTLDRIRANLYVLLDIVRNHVLNARFTTVKEILFDLNSQLEDTFESL